jgi:Undecaprenyl-phosphate glucose phosphotransferase
MFGSLGASSYLSVATLSRSRAARAILNTPTAVLHPLLIVLAGLATKIVYVDMIVGDPRDMLPFFAASVTCALIFSTLVRGDRISNRASGDSESRERPMSFLPPLLAAFAAIITLGFASKTSSEFSRVWLGSWLLVSTILLQITRPLDGWVRRYLREHRIGLRRVAVAHLGNDPGLSGLLSTFEKDRSVQIVTSFCINPNGAVGRDDSETGGLSRQPGFEEVIVCSGGLRPEAAQIALRYFQSMPVGVHVFSNNVLARAPICGITTIGGVTLFTMSRNPIQEWSWPLKRVLDFAASVTLLVLLAPLFALIATAIKLDSRGPVLFRQRRRGCGWSVFNVWKFRTMHVQDDGAHILQATRNDPRVTRIGRFLRRTSLDELPQLFNVVAGDMSLVGPRPHAVAHDEHYGKLIDGYTMRHRVKPGITGWAQVNGLRGPTPDPQLMSERIRYDLDYIENWSFWFDLEVLLLTLIYGFSHRNAV